MRATRSNQSSCAVHVSYRNKCLFSLIVHRGRTPSVPPSRLIASKSGVISRSVQWAGRSPLHRPYWLGYLLSFPVRYNMNEVSSEYRASDRECSCSYSPPEIPSRRSVSHYLISYLNQSNPRPNRQIQPSLKTRNRLIQGVEAA